MISPSPQIALVTGAGSGIGKATALALAKAGYTVVLTGRRPDPLAAVAAAAAGNTHAIPADLTDPTSVNALFETIKTRFGRLDLLFNNAGANNPGVRLEDLSYDDWRMVIDINLTGMFLCTQAAFRIMKDQAPRGGRIINNGSISASAPRPHSIAYTASKHAVTGLTKSTSLDGRPYDIACGQIDIGNAATDMTSRMTGGVPQADLSLRPEPTFDVAHVAETIVHMAGLPLDTNVQFITIMATKMPLIGRG